MTVDQNPRDRRNEAFNQALNAFRDCVLLCPDVPPAEKAALITLAFKAGPALIDERTVPVVTVSVRDLAADLGVGRDVAARLLKNLRHNKWICQAEDDRSAFVLRIPAHDAAGGWMDRCWTRERRIRTTTAWENVARREEKRSGRLDRTRVSEGHGQADSGPRTNPSEGHGQARPWATDTDRPRATDTATVGHGQTAAVSPYKPSPATEALGPKPMPTGETLPAVATPPGHPVPRPGGTETPGAADRLPEPTTADLGQQPQDAHAHNADEGPPITHRFTFLLDDVRRSA